MKRRIIILSIFILIGLGYTKAQTLSDFYEATKKRSFVIESGINTLRNYGDEIISSIDTPTVDHKVSYLYFSFTVKKGYRKTNQFAFYYDWEWRFLSDWIGIVTPIVVGAVKSDYTKSNIITRGGWFSNSLLGFHNFGINLNSSEKMVFRSGLNYSDYQYYLRGRVQGSVLNEGAPYARENGEYFTLGFFGNMDYLLTDNLMFSSSFVFSPFTFAAYYRPYTPDGTFQAVNKKEFKFGGRKDGIKSPVFTYFNVSSI